MGQSKIAVIGAGFGGLSVAIKLANSGFKVDVFESNYTPGGKASELKIDGFRFDTGPSLLTMPFVLEDIFKECNEDINEYLTIEKLDIICKYFYQDGTTINAYSNKTIFATEIEDNTTDSKVSVNKYLAYCKTIYNLTAELFLFKSPSKFKTFLNKKALNTLLNIKKIDSFRTMHQANSSFFRDEKTIQLFDRYATYNGSNPYKAPATLNIIQHVEYNLGAFIVKKGIYEIVNALFNLAIKKGVDFHLHKKVQKIKTSNNKIIGIEVDNKFLEYDNVISNVDVNVTYRNLIEDKNKTALNKLNKLEPSLSGIVFYWGVKGNHDFLETHNILFSENYKKEFEEIFEQKIIPIDPTIYIYISSKFNKNDAPENCENWFVMINAPFIENQTWNDEIKNLRERIFKKVNSVLNIEIKNKIIFERVLTPIDIENLTGSYKGSIYGISSNDRKTAFRRHPNKSPYFKNLYFCGGSVHPGGGIPLTLLSGKIAAELIKKDFKG